MLTVVVLFIIILFCWLLYKLYQWAERRTGQPENEEQAEQLESEIVPEQHEKEWQAESKTVEKIHLTEPTSEAQYVANEPKYRNYPGYPPDWEWRTREVKKRDRYTCQASKEKVGLPKCGKTGSENELDIHHIIPISKGGNHSFENLITLCSSCHEKLHPHMRLGLYVEILPTTGSQMAPNVHLLQEAITNKKDVWMDYYTAYRDDRNERTVTPINIYYRNGAAYLRAYCHWRKKERTFKVSRIRNMRVLDGEKLYQPTQEKQRQPSKQKQQRPPQIAVEKLKQQRNQPQAHQPKVVRKVAQKVEGQKKPNPNNWKEPDPFLEPFLDPKLGWEERWSQKSIDLLEEEVLNLDMTQEGCLPLWFPWTLFKPPKPVDMTPEYLRRGISELDWDGPRVPPDYGEPIELNPQQRARAFHEILDEMLVSSDNPKPSQPYASLSTEQKLKLKSTVAECLLGLYEGRDEPYDLPTPQSLLNPQATRERGNRQMPSKKQPTTRFVRPYQPLSEEVQERLLNDLLKDLESEKKLRTYLRSQPKQP